MLSKLLMPLSLFLAAGTVQAQGIIHNLVGSIDLPPVLLTLENPDGATNIDVMLNVVGSLGGQGAMQQVNLSNGTVGSVQLFDSFLSANGGGNTTGTVRVVQKNLLTGEILYMGQSAVSASLAQPST